MLSGWTRESSYAHVGTGARFDLWQSCCSLIEDFAQVFLVGHHQIKPFAQNLAALFRAFRFPSWQCGLSGGHGTVCFGFAHLWHGTDHFAIGRIGDFYCCLIVGIQPYAIDVTLGFEQSAVL